MARKLKILVTGAFNAGKSAFVRTACDGATVHTERAVTGDQQATKTRTTVALDFGQLLSPRGNQLLLFGTPGQERFAPMRQVLARGTAGGVLVVDCADRTTLGEAQEFARWLRDSPWPLVVAANKQDQPNAVPAAELRALLGLPSTVGLVACCALKRAAVLAVLDELEAAIARGI
ncbi:MAG TPA: ADP-ribosylation factor-like protein [Chloroflexota bacterium]|nr:ADP-ribosylation factor-like protein [Chloroflexota bacterium]